MSIMKLLILFITHIIILKISPAQAAATVSSQYSCINPNNRTGVCISLYACPTILKLYLNSDISSSEDRDFVQGSYCSNGFGASPFVCCSADIHYDVNEADLIDNTRLASPEECVGHTAIYQYGGGTADILDYHWIGILQYRIGTEYYPGCLGSLINHRYILTAALCFHVGIVEEVPKFDRVVLGEYDVATDIDCLDGICLEPVTYVGIEKIYEHDQFNSRRRLNDLALIRLTENVMYNKNIAPICLPSVTGFKGSRTGDGLMFSGWQTNKIFIDQEDNVTVKLFLNLPIYEQAKCVEYFKQHNLTITDKQLCAGGNPGEGVCIGDIGGPLMTKYNRMWTIEGIVSFGLGTCGVNNVPNVYTRVSKYEDWIIKNLEK